MFHAARAQHGYDTVFTVSARPKISETAFHEAAHAVIAHHLGREVVSISVVPSTSSDGKALPALTVFAPWPETLSKQIRGEREIIISYAGGIAQERYTSDEIAADRAAESDRIQAIGEAKYLWPNVEEASEQLRRLLDDTRWLVDRYWAEIERVANALLSRDTLTGAEFAKLLSTPSQ
jgi:hypothetical protein